MEKSKIKRREPFLCWKKGFVGIMWQDGRIWLSIKRERKMGMRAQGDVMHIVFFDIDGTLAIRKDVPVSAERAIKALRENGDLSFICTGRSLAYVRDNFAAYADGFVCSNGRLAVKGSQVLYDHPLDKEQVKDIVAKLDEIGCGYAFFGTEHGYYGGDPDGFAAMAAAWDKGFMKRMEDIGETLVYNFDVYFKDKEQRIKIEQALEGNCLLNPHGPHPSADVTVLGIDKGTALLAVAQALGVAIEDTYAFGDGINDLCMLEAAGHGIAMGNAMAQLKEKAEYVTSDIRDDGVARGLAHYRLVQGE